MTTSTHKGTARLVTVISAALVALAVSAPLAQAARVHHQDCTQTVVQSQYPGWVSVTDEQGVPTLYPIGYAPDDNLFCTQTLDPSADSNAQTTSSASAGTTMQSPYAGWVIVVDEQGVPTLFPIGMLFN